MAKGILFSRICAEQQAASRVPDLRDLLFWAPRYNSAGKEKKEFSFYTPYAREIPGSWWQG